MQCSFQRLALGCAAFAVSLSAVAQQVVISKENRTIAVTTSAEATADADVVTVEIGFIVYGADQNVAYAAGTKSSNAIASALKAAGVPADAIQSETQGIGPVQQYNNEWTPEERAQRKFQVQQSWSVKAAPAEGANVLHVAVQAGANQSGQMNWSVADQDALQAKAARLALEHARQIAQQMASGLNAVLGPLVYASNEAPSVRPLNGRISLSGPYHSLEAFAPLKPLSVSAQKVTTSATVYAVFSIQ